jgi:hypothetical protein
MIAASLAFASLPLPVLPFPRKISASAPSAKLETVAT